MISKRPQVRQVDPGRRAVIVHDHLFKNAGTTIDWILERNFGPNFIDHRDDENMKKGPAFFKNFVLENSFVQAISSHHFTLPLPDLPDIDFILIKMFRDPIERVLSVYDFEKRQSPDQSPGASYANSHSFEEYLRWRLSSESVAVVRNFHVRRLLDGPYRKMRITDELYSMALSNLKKVGLVGIVEHFDESMILFKAELDKYFEGIDLSYIPQNVNREKGIPGKDVREPVQNLLPRHIYDALLNENKYDLMLYEYVVEDFYRKMSHVAFVTGS